MLTIVIFLGVISISIVDIYQFNSIYIMYR